MPVMILVIFLDLLGFGLIIPLLPFYAVHFSPDHPFPVTMLMATYSGVQLLSAPFWGRMSDRIGRRPVVLTALSTSVVAYILMAHADEMWMLFVARALQGASGGSVGVAQAYVADVSTPENRVKGMGLIGAAFGLGFTLGPAFGGWLAGPDPAAPDVTAPSYAAAGLSGLALILAIVLLKEPLSPELRRRARQVRARGRWALVADLLSRRHLKLYVALFFMVTFAFAAMEATFGQWALARLHWGPRAVGWAFLLVGLTLASVQGGFIRLVARRLGEARLVLAGTVLIGIGMAGLAVGMTPLAGAVFCGVLALGEGLAGPAISTLVSRAAGPSEQGTVLATNQSIGSLARFVGPASAGVLFEFYGAGAPYVLGAFVMVLASLLAAYLVRLSPAIRPMAAAT